MLRTHMCRKPLKIFACVLREMQVSHMADVDSILNFLQTFDSTFLVPDATASRVRSLVQKCLL